MKRISILLALALLLTTIAAGLATADDNSSATGYPIAAEPVTYTALAGSDPGLADDFSTYTSMAYWSELTNIYFEWSYISMTDWDTQINLKLAAGDIPDMIYNPLTTTQLQTYGVEGGMFVNYADYMDEYMPNAKAAFEADPDLAAYATMLDGGIYSLPRKVWTYTMASPIYYRGDMMAELGAQVPTTVDEFYDLLVLAKEKYAAVEGFYPVISNTTNLHQNLFPAFGDAWQVGYGDNGDGKVVYNHTSDQWRHYLEFAAKLYSEGLLDPELFTMDGATINAKVKGGQCLVIGGVGTQLTTEHYASGKIETKVLPPLVSEYTSEQKSLDINPLGYAGRVINANCKNPEYLMRYFDMFYTEIADMQNGTCGLSSWLGIYETNWAITEDGKNYYRVLPEDMFGLSEEEYKNKYVIDSNYLGLVVLDLFPINNPTQEMKAHESAEGYYPYMKYRMLDTSFKYTDDESSTLAGLTVDIDTYVNTAIAQFITGVQVLDDSSWEAYVGTINSMGLEQVLELKQLGYDRWNGAK